MCSYAINAVGCQWRSLWFRSLNTFLFKIDVCWSDTTVFHWCCQTSHSLTDQRPNLKFGSLLCWGKRKRKIWLAVFVVLLYLQAEKSIFLQFIFFTSSSIHNCNNSCALFSSFFHLLGRTLFSLSTIFAQFKVTPTFILIPECSDNWLNWSQSCLFSLSRI